jgi:UDP-N-acetylmuramoyl-tripeptide--D-alanyl-D-alanine ligase
VIGIMSLSQIADSCGGKLSEDIRFKQVCTDTRKLQRGDLFVALNGENFDGNQFVEKAAGYGAAAVVVSQEPEVDIPYLLVDDPRHVLGLIARNNRRQFNGPVIGLTGSTGKTTCKEMLAAILAECGAVLATQGNFNNEVGVPATLLAISGEHKTAVIEMGASRAGDIRYLCQFAEPTIALVTNAMSAHLEGFGSLEVVAATKGEIFEGVSDDGVAIINLDDPFSQQWREQANNKRVVTFSANNSEADFFAREVQISAEAKLKFVLSTGSGEVEINLSVLGRHNLSNALAAGAAAIEAGANLQQVKLGLEKVGSVKGRLQSVLTSGGKIIIDDSYNANPGSVKAAIDVLADYSDANPRTCLVLGTMAELGEQAMPLHQEVAAYARDQGINKLIIVGEYASQAITSFGSEGVAFDYIDELLSELEKHTQADIVLVKGSRSAHMEKVVCELMSDADVVNSDVVNNNLGGH